MRAVRNLIARFAPSVVVFSLSSSLSAAAVIRVPQDHVLIAQAVAAARDDDIVEVDDGFYFEKNIVIDKAITLRARHLFGAAVYGSPEPNAAVFIIRAACAIDGFILKNAAVGLLQRDSPDVLWTGRNLALFNMDQAVSLNDRYARCGAARLSDIICAGCRTGFSTNDARSFDISRVLAANAEVVFSGSNHVSFEVRDVVAWNCRRLTVEDGPSLSPPSSNRIIERVEDDRRAFLIEIRTHDRQDPLPRFRRAAGIEEIRPALLAPGIALLEFVLGEAKSFAFLAKAEGLWIAELPSEAFLRPRIANYLKFLTLRESGDFRGAAGGRALADLLLARFWEHLTRDLKMIHVVPDGVLHYLPFETLNPVGLRPRSVSGRGL